MWKRLGLALVLLAVFGYAWRALESISIEVVGQPSMTGPVQSTLEQPFFENLSRTTGLPLEVRYRPIDTLGIRDNYQLRLLKEGALDLVSLRLLQNVDSEPSLLGVDLIGLNTSFEGARAIVQAYTPVLDRRLQEQFSTKLLGVWPFGPQVFFCRMPIRGLADLAGRRVRVGNGFFAPLITALGATPAVVAFEDVGDALKNGLVDCAISSATSGNAAGWGEHTTHFFSLGTQMGLNGYVIRLSLWNRLSAQQQRRLELAFSQQMDRMWAFAKEIHQDASACNTGGPCRYGNVHRMVWVTPSTQDHRKLQQLFYQTTFAAWADQCNRRYPGCSQEWQSVVMPVLAQHAAEAATGPTAPSR